ncbi:methyltransferase domain-containing protein, partial [Candidatus Woesearchaeota archaeon]|nr:methyltransferase domain-containing protein [Candidatus Woesearchaeota archaeon]
MKPIKKVLFSEGSFYYWKEGDLHTDKGIIKEEQIKKGKEIISNTGKEFKIVDPSFVDLLAKMKRGPQIMIPKDVGLIFSRTNIDKDSIVVEAGTGSGASALHLARFVKKVISYERREEFHKIAKENVEFFQAKNVILKLADIELGIEEKNVDFILLDLAEPWKVIDITYNALKQGSYLAVYLPNITQMMHFVEKAREK